MTYEELDKLIMGLTRDDRAIARHMMMDEMWRLPDLVIAPDGEAYIYRWHLVKTPQACCYFHIQVASDPERPLHDHPWDNTSVILAGGYDEIIWEPGCQEITWYRKPGDVIHRKATDAHRLILPAGVPYTMSLFSTGPKVREWGFWYPDGWRPYTDVTRTVDGKSVHVHRETM